MPLFIFSIMDEEGEKAEEEDSISLYIYCLRSAGTAICPSHENEMEKRNKKKWIKGYRKRERERENKKKQNSVA